MTADEPLDPTLAAEIAELTAGCAEVLPADGLASRLAEAARRMQQSTGSFRC